MSGAGRLANETGAWHAKRRKKILIVVHRRDTEVAEAGFFNRGKAKERKARKFFTAKAPRR